jgi:hypothetical protein
LAAAARVAAELKVLENPALQVECQHISHIDIGDDRIDTLISHIISPYPMSISRMTISIW